MHYLDLSDYFFSGVMVEENLWNKFDGDDLAGLFVLGFDYLSEGALSNEIEDLKGWFYIFPDAW